MADELTDRKCKTAEPGRYSDGRGLIFVVKPSGSRSWVFRYQRRGKRIERGLGPYPEVSLKEARAGAADCRKRVLQGLDPIEKAEPKRVVTFRDAALATIKAKRSGWRNPKHAKQWLATLDQHVFPTIGDTDVADVDTAAVKRVLTPIWDKTPETASRVRQRIEAILNFATTDGLRSGPNPALWRGHLQNILSSPKKVQPVQHFKAIPYGDIPDVWQTLSPRETPAYACLKFILLTACRSNEARAATWQEVDQESRLWKIPEARTKAGKEHFVPLSDAAWAVLEPARVASLEPENLLFPSMRGRELWDVGVSKALKAVAGDADATVHGLRSTFRDWAGETTNHQREVIEHALAHRLKDKAEAAYARGTLLKKRRVLMSDWANYVTGKSSPQGGAK